MNILWIGLLLMILGIIPLAIGMYLEKGSSFDDGSFAMAMILIMSGLCLLGFGIIISLTIAFFL